MAESLCGTIAQSRRGLLALTWSVVTLLTAASFLIALLVAISANYDPDDYENDENAYGDQADVAVTSRALVFTSLWTVCLATVLAVFGAVVLGFQSPTGDYYTCCSSSVFRTSPLGFGSFVGALMMFANCTFVCSVLFGEFQVSIE